MKITKKIGSGIIILSVLLVTANIGCKSNKSDNKGPAALLLLTSTQLTPEKAASYTVIASGGVSSSVSTAAKANQISFNFPNPKDYRGIAKLIARHRLDEYSKQFKAGIIPTSLTKVSGTCSTSGCTNAVLAGTINCPMGGTVTLNNVTVSNSITSSPPSMSFSSYMNGGVTMSNCTTQSADYLNYPDYVTATVTGDLTYNGNYSMNFSSFNMTSSSMSTSGSYTDSSTMNSSGLTINGQSGIGLETVTTNININFNLSVSNMVSSSNNNNYTYTATYQDTVSGTAAITGKAAGQSINVNRQFNNETFIYTVSCSLNMNDFSGSCTITK